MLFRPRLAGPALVIFALVLSACVAAPPPTPQVATVVLEVTATPAAEAAVTPAATEVAAAEATPEAAEDTAAEAAPADELSGVLTGNVILPEGTTLAPDAAVMLEIQDITDPSAPGVLTSQAFPAGRMQSPVPFEAFYDPATISEEGTFAVFVRITEGGNLAYANAEPVLVLSGGNPITNVDVPVETAAEQPAAAGTPGS